MREVPVGLAISALFEGSDGDPIRCYVRRTATGWRMEDDGSFLADLEASGMNVTQGDRAKFLSQALATANAHVEIESLRMVAEGDGPQPDPRAVVSFLSALTRARDVAFWTRERVRSTFKTDAAFALAKTLSGQASIDETGVVEGLKDYQADLVIKPAGTRGFTTAVFLAQNLETLTEALLLRMTLNARSIHKVRVAALIEDGSVSLSARKAVRAINQLDGFAVFGPSEPDAPFRIGRTAIPDLEPVTTLH